MASLTKSQRRELEAAARHQLGIVECYAVNGLGRAQWRLMMERLRLAGFVTPYPHGGYQITDAGRKSLSSGGSYGFTCGYCEEQLDTPFDDHERASQFAQEQGWRMTLGNSPRWGEGANNTCPRCAENDATAKPIWVKP